MKKKLTSIAAVALCLLAGVALAATLVYSQRFDQTARADALLAETYGITADKLSFFSRAAEGDVYTYTGLTDFCGMLGDYRVNLATSEVQWLFDGPEGSGWGAEKLSEINLRCQQEGSYHDAVTEARAAAQALGMTLPASTPPTPEEMDAAVAESAEKMAQAQSLAKLSIDEAVPLARAAIQETYGLTDARMARLEFVPDSTHYRMLDDVPVISAYFWLNQQEGAYTEGDGIYIADVNALDGSIEETYYDNALLGNG